MNKKTKKLEGKSLTQQHFAKTNDIRNIVNRYTKRGATVDDRASAPGNFGNFSSSLSYHEMQNRLLDANRKFAALPAQIRAYFNNDAGNLIDFVKKLESGDQKAIEQAVKIGFLPEKYHKKTSAEIGEEIAKKQIDEYKKSVEKTAPVTSGDQK